MDEPGPVEAHINPYMTTSEQAAAQGASCSKEGAALLIQELPALVGRALAAKMTQPCDRAIQFVANPALKSKLKVPPREKT